MKNARLLILFALLFSSLQELQSQVYAGGGYVYSSLSPTGLDDVKGFGIDIQKEFSWEGSRINFTPTLHVTVLNSNFYRKVNAFYANTISLAPLVSYALVERERISIAPFASPFVGWLVGVRKGDLLFAAGYRDEIVYGVELGLEFKVMIYENLEVKINPITLQIGDNYFRQGMVSLLFRLSK